MLTQAAVRYLMLFILFFALLYLRRSAQLLHPQVWDEDGTEILPGLLDHGLKSLFFPINGYLIVVPKLISAISLAISGLYYPLVSTVITWGFIVGVCIAISLSPTWLKGGVLLGVATLLVPCDPEVFGVPLYSFWWASLLLFLVVLWEQDSNDIKFRICFTLLGGLSSPIIFLVTPFLAVRAVVFRKRKRELAILAAALFCCGMQALAALHTGQVTAGTINHRNQHEILPKFIGYYLAGNYRHATSNLLWFAAGVLVAFFLMATPFILRRPQYLFLVGLWAGTVYLVGRRLDLSLIHPRLAGPRYFFLPFVLVSWFLVSFLRESRRRDLQLFAAGLLLISLLNMLPVRSRTHQDFHWAEHLSNCGKYDGYSIPISWDGQTPWLLKVSRDQCVALQRAGLFNLRSRLP